jgi:hypothetical protein
VRECGELIVSGPGSIRQKQATEFEIKDLRFQKPSAPGHFEGYAIYREEAMLDLDMKNRGKVGRTMRQKVS